MADVAIVGAGSMAGAIGGRVLAVGNSVVVVHPEAKKAGALAEELRDRAAGPATVTATTPAFLLRNKIVVLAVPHETAASVIDAYGENLRGRVLVDISNPIERKSLQLLVTPSGSAAEETAQLVPQAHCRQGFQHNVCRDADRGRSSRAPPRRLHCRRRRRRQAAGRRTRFSRRPPAHRCG